MSSRPLPAPRWLALAGLWAAAAHSQVRPEPAAPATPAAPAASAAATRPAVAAPAPAEAPASQRIVVEGRSNDAAEQRRRSTVATTVVGRDELDAYGDTSVLDVLQRLPGISIEGDAPKLRGMGSGYTQILLNGEPAPPGFSLDSLSPSEIERIEIVKGPTAEFGAVSGTINVILRSPPKLQQREWRASGGYRAVRPQGSTSFSWGNRIGPVGIYLPISAYNWANAGDLEVVRSSRSRDGTVSRQRVNGRDEWLGGGVNLAPRLDWKINDHDTLQWQAFLQRNESDNRSRRSTSADAGPPPSYASDSSRNTSRWQLARTQAQWVRKADNGSRLELKTSAQGSLWRGDGAWLGITPGFLPGPLRNSVSSHRERSTVSGARWRTPLGEQHTLNLGVDDDLRHRRELNRRLDDGIEQFTSTLGSPFTAVIRRQTAFLQDEWAYSEQSSLQAGLRVERARLRVAGPTTAADARYQVVSPVLHWRHALDAQARDVVRVGVARSIRVPDIGLVMPRYSLNGTYDKDTANTPLAADSAGNPMLQPEKAWALDVRMEHYLPGGGVLSVGAFHRQIENLIRRRIALETVAEASVPRWISRPANIGRARSSGLELELKGQGHQLLGRWWAAAPKALTLRTALSVYRSAVEQVDDPDARLEGQAPWTVTAGFDHTAIAPGWTVGATLGYTPGFSTQQTDRQRVWRGAARRSDAYVLWRIDRQTSWRFAINNAWPADSLSSSRVEDLDGFAAASSTRRSNTTQVNTTFQTRF